MSDLRPDPKTPASFPCDTQAEKAVLAALLLSPVPVAEICAERGVDAETFYVPAHAELFRTIMAMISLEKPAERKPVDFITLATELKNANALEKVGGGPALQELFVFLPTAANVRFYIESIQDKATLRNIIATCNEYARRAYSGETPTRELLEAFQIDTTGITMQGKSIEETARQIKSALMEAMQKIEKTYRTRGRVAGTSTGIFAMDRMTGGLEPGNLVVIAGRPSMGKSALLWDMGMHISTHHGPVLGFSLEMSTVEIAQRFICWEAGINIQRVRDGFLSDAQMAKLAPTSVRLAALKQWIDETPGISIQEIRARARRFKAKHPDMAAVVIDYLQLCKSHTRSARDNRVLEIAEISGGLKEMAKELKIPVIVGAQLNRDNEKGKVPPPPKLSNLRESGSIEQDADIVGLIHRRHYYSHEEEDVGKATIILAKQRNGPTGPVEMEFTDAGRFRNPEGEAMYSNNPAHRQGAHHTPPPNTDDDE